MKHDYLHKGDNANLLLFFAGWGAEPSLFGKTPSNGWDCIVCYDYKDLEFDATMLEGYSRVRLLAWSMGVWAASQTFSGMDAAFEAKIAVNGTETPVDDDKGILAAVFKATLDGFSATALAKFRRRMCGSADAVRTFLSHCPSRPVDDLHAELETLAGMVASRPEKRMQWDKCIIGNRDKIFPPANMARAWSGQHTAMLDVEHYDEALFMALLNAEDECWIKT